MNISTFVFNAFMENTYILYDASKQCVIIDPGCSTLQEQKTLTDFITQNGLTPTHLVNTHCHIDHVLGNKFVSDTYGLELSAHEGEKVVLDMQPQVAEMYGISYDPLPDIIHYLKEGEELVFGDSRMSILFTPGHSPASISLYHKESAQLIAGDVLFQGSIGRTDLPGGNYDTLINSIQENIFTLPDGVKVYSGHGNSTNVGVEKRTNPFFQ